MDSRILHVDLDQRSAVGRVVPYDPKAGAPLDPRVGLGAALGLIDLPVRRELGQHLQAILGDFSTRIEPLALDQCWLDVTDNHAGLPNATAVARRIRERVRSELGLIDKFKSAVSLRSLKLSRRLGRFGRRR